MKAIVGVLLVAVVTTVLARPQLPPIGDLPGGIAPPSTPAPPIQPPAPPGVSPTPEPSSSPAPEPSSSSAPEPEVPEPTISPQADEAVTAEAVTLPAQGNVEVPGVPSSDNPVVPVVAVQV